jgi:hypothetical protein
MNSYPANSSPAPLRADIDLAWQGSCSTEPVGEMTKHVPLPAVFESFRHGG